MSKALKACLIFASGFIAGGVASYLVTSKKAQDEFNAQVKNLQDIHDSHLRELEEKYEKKAEETKEKASKYVESIKNYSPVTPEVEKEIETSVEACEIAAKEITKEAKKIKKTEKESAKKFEVITQQEYDSETEYGRMTITHYSDNTLADEDHNIVYAKETVGVTNFNIFEATYEATYVRNNSTRMVYELLHSNRKYSEVMDNSYEE